MTSEISDLLDNKKRMTRVKAIAMYCLEHVQEQERWHSIFIASKAQNFCVGRDFYGVKTFIIRERVNIQGT